MSSQKYVWVICSVPSQKKAQRHFSRALVMKKKFYYINNISHYLDKRQNTFCVFSSSLKKMVTGRLVDFLTLLNALDRNGWVYFDIGMNLLLTFWWIFQVALLTTGAINKYLAVWLDVARPVNICFKLSILGNAPAQPYSIPHPQKYVCKVQKITNSLFATVSSSNMKFDKV